MIGIYTIRNVVTNQLYVGSSVNVTKRLREHLSSLKRGDHANKYLQRSFDKYKETSFVFTAEELVENKEDLLTIEQEWISVLKNDFSLYNLCRVAGSCLGKKHSEVAKQKMSRAKIGTAFAKGHVVSDETKAILSAKATKQWEDFRRGTSTIVIPEVSKETRQKMSLARTGKKLPEDVRAKMAASQKQAWILRKAKAA